MKVFWQIVQVGQTWVLLNGEVVRIESIQALDGCYFVTFNRKVFINGGKTVSTYYEPNGCHNRIGTSPYDLMRKVV